MVKYYNTRAGELYRAALAEYVRELSKPHPDWNKLHELSDKAAKLMEQAMGEA